MSVSVRGGWVGRGMEMGVICHIFPQQHQRVENVLHVATFFPSCALCRLYPAITHTHKHTQAAIKSELLKSLVEETEKSVLHKVCDTVSELAAELMDRNEWPELLPALQVSQQQQE